MLLAVAVVGVGHDPLQMGFGDFAANPGHAMRTVNVGHLDGDGSWGWRPQGRASTTISSFPSRLRPQQYCACACPSS